jgi:gas vesicle protein GvpL/GvpF
VALYVYGLMRAQDAADAASGKRSDTAPALRAVEHQGLSALVSQMPEGAIRLRRESLLAHSDVLQTAFAHGPVLPLRFGTSFPDEAALERELLAPRADVLLARLDALEGAAEMQVKATYLEEPLLRSVLAGDPRLARAAERIRGLPAAATHFERIRLGEAIGAAIQGRREADAEALLGRVSSLAIAVAIGELQHERMVLSASFLVHRSKLEEFDAAVEQLSESYASQMQFRLLGPMPAHSFADREWESAGENMSSAWA